MLSTFLRPLEIQHFWMIWNHCQCVSRRGSVMFSSKDLRSLEKVILFDPGLHTFLNLSLSQLGGDSKAVGEHLRHQHSQSGAAEEQLWETTGPGGVSLAADGRRHAETGPGHNSSLSAERPGDQVCQGPDGGSTARGRADEYMVYIWQTEWCEGKKSQTVEGRYNNEVREGQWMIFQNRSEFLLKFRY